MTTNYRRGEAVAYKCRDRLLDAGWWVIKAAGSKGVADLVALKYGTAPVLIQVKNKPGPLPPNERAELFQVALSLGATPIHAHPAGRGVICWRKLTGSKHPDEFELWNPEANA